MENSINILYFLKSGQEASGRGTHANRSKGRGQTKCSPLSYGFGIGRGANKPPAEIPTVTKPPGHVKEAMARTGL
jgi:hypothetical protein